MNHAQPGILADVPSAARHLLFSLRQNAETHKALTALSEQIDGSDTVVGLGLSTIKSLGKNMAGLRAFPSYAGSGFDVPSTPTALWCWLRGNDRGELVHRTRKISNMVSPAFALEATIDAFEYGESRDLTGYEDGTENPEGEEAIAAAIVQSSDDHLNGSSFVAVQQWIHDLDRFEAMSRQERDHTIGRRHSDNEEIDDAPASAHVKRTAQEDFEPAAFVLRRSLPWANEKEQGLVFVAFGRSLDPFEALLRRMVGEDDGISDALFTFTHPVSGSYFWCPPVRDGRLYFRALGL